MDEFARAATLDDLKSLLRSLERHGVEYLLIGGYALAAHGYQRATTDIDVMVKGTTEVGEKMKSALMVLPDQVAKDIERALAVMERNIQEVQTSGLHVGPVAKQIKEHYERR